MDVNASFFALCLLAIILLNAGCWALYHYWRGSSSEVRGKQLASEEQIHQVMQAHMEMSGRLMAMTDMVRKSQSDMAHFISERLEGMSSKLGQSLEHSSKTAGENLSKLNERLVLIDHAQGRLSQLTQEVLSLREILSNKQTRGAFGQGRMEAIIRDGLPHYAYEFQATLSNNMRPDCLIRLPGDKRGLVVDAKFPLEAFSAFTQAPDEVSRKQAMIRIRSDMSKHIKDIAERYFIPGETQDLAVLFVPSESLYADLSEHFEDVMQKAHRNRMIIVSPSLLMMALQIMQSLVRDDQIRQQAHIIQREVQKILEDVDRLKQRITKLDIHFRQAQEDLLQINISSEKIATRGQKITNLDFSEDPSTESISLSKEA